MFAADANDIIGLRSALGVIAAEALTHRDGYGGELVAQSWNAQWAGNNCDSAQKRALVQLDVLYRYE
jgi:hypothetical protein